MFEIFLIVLALIWILFATISDLKTHEVPNWLCFSLIVFALGYRFFYSLFLDDWTFFIQGVIGLVIFLVLGFTFYYGRLFAGGDAKLMIALGSVLALSSSFIKNVSLFFNYILLFLVIGALYGLVASIYLFSKNSDGVKKEFKKQLVKNKKKVFLILYFGLLSLILSFFEFYFIFLSLTLIIVPFLFISFKSIDEVAMVAKVRVSELTEGDWLYEDVVLKSRTIKANWDGLSKNEISLLKKHKKYVLIRRGIAFVPVFLFSYLIWIFFYFYQINLFSFL